MNNGELANRLAGCVTRGRVLTAPAQLAGYAADGLGYKTFQPDAVVLPADADELVEIVRNARQLDAPVCIRGAGTSLSGGPVAAQGGVVVHTSALRSVRTIDPQGFWCEVECGVTLNALDKQLEPHGVFYPPDPSSGPVCTLGGNVAMNAGGAHCFRYGVTSNYVLGVEVVLPDGDVQRFGGPAGGRGAWREDWKRLMVGSEGTLGAFTRFWLRLLPRPEKVWTFRATFEDLVSAERAIHGLVAHHSFPAAIEMMDPRCVDMVENSPMAVGLPRGSFMILTEIDGPQDLVDQRVDSVAEILRAAGSKDVVYSDEAEQRRKLWKARKVAGGLAGQISPDFLVQDTVIPKSALADVLQLVYDEADAAGLPAVNVFHAGDGNLHPNFLFDSRNPGELEKVEAISKRLMQRAVEVGGTLSGEHGIGNDKSAYMPLVFGQDSLRLQLTVPALFNPRHQLNPLKVFTQRRFHGNGLGSTDRNQDSVGDKNGRSEVNAEPPTEGGREARCFKAFLDPIDGILCVGANATAQEIEAQAAPHGLRFPLILDDHAPLAAQIAASGFAPASSRYGPYCDNIVGMNWRLPSGRVIRLGERVVKTTTGYDLFRFVLNASGDFGEPVDLVLRLRTIGGQTGVGSLDGRPEAVEAAIRMMLQSCWIHWFESLDLVCNREADSANQIRVVINCPSKEMPIAERYLAIVAEAHQLELSFSHAAAPPYDGCPDFVLKTTPDRVLNLARQVASASNANCIALCYHGVVHGYVANQVDAVEIVRAIIGRFGDALHAIGGDWHSRHVPRASGCEVEQRWLELLEREFAGS